MGLNFRSVKQVVVKGVAEPSDWLRVAPGQTFSGTQKGSHCLWSAAGGGYSLPTRAVNPGFPGHATQPSEQTNAIRA